MLVSSTSINAASETATAMIQGLPWGRQISSPELATVAAVIGPPHQLQRNRAEHRTSIAHFDGFAFKTEFVNFSWHPLVDPRMRECEPFRENND
jgi:hypothetical protein